MTATEIQLEDVELERAVASLTARRSRGTRSLYSVLGALGFVGIWSFFSLFVYPPYVLPAPWSVARRMWELTVSGEVFSNFLASFLKTMLGWVLALALGIPIGLLMGRFRYAKAFLHDFVYILANVPLIVYAVVALLVFGINPFGPAFVVMLEVLPGVAINVAAGVESVDRGLLAMSRSFRRRSSQTARSVVIPSIVPFLFAGGRVSFANSWKLAALAETFGGTTGVGVQIEKSFQLFSVVSLLAWMFFFVIFVIAVERFMIAPFERWVFRWRRAGGADEGSP